MFYGLPLKRGLGGCGHGFGGCDGLVGLGRFGRCDEFSRFDGFREFGGSSNINEVIRPVLNFLFFFYDKISQALKSTKKYQKALKSTKKH